MIDFKEIAAKSSLYNFHSHTQYCDGRAPMEDLPQKPSSWDSRTMVFRPTLRFLRHRHAT